LVCIANVILESSDAGGGGGMFGKEPVSAGHSSQRRWGKGETSEAAAGWLIGCRWLRGCSVGGGWEEEGGGFEGMR
jgi:hypothetical protein